VVLVVLGVLMVGLNGLAREERRATERRPARQPVPAPPRPERELQPLAIERPEPTPDIPLFDADADTGAPLFKVEQEPAARPSPDGTRRRRSGISPDALEELLDL
jgi:hypothetical protein